jgi:hypothetical protein
MEDHDVKMEDGEKPKKKEKKPHRGYGFVVFEREKDMKSLSPIPLAWISMSMPHLKVITECLTNASAPRSSSI